MRSDNMHTHSSPLHNVAIVILAAGKGTRMQNGNGGLPKVLTPLYGQPLISHLLHSIESCRVERPPTIVVGHQAELVKEKLGPHYEYVEQKEQLGTGHAVMAAREALEGKVEHVLVLYGDHPHLPCQVIDDLLDLHLGYGNAVTMATTRVPDFTGWHERLLTYGRIIRGPKKGKDHYILRIVEYKDATEEERAITELNPGYYCFEANWLWEHLDAVQNKNSANEYYITDLIAMAIEEGVNIGAHEIKPLEAAGVNSMEELKALEVEIDKEKS